MDATVNLPEIKGFVETSFVDWPGKVSSVIFLSRCNFRCPYCHNHRLVEAPEGFVTWDLAAILERMDHFRGWVDGVCVTGGEPTVHASLPALLRVFRKACWPVKLDTNGSRPEVVEALLRESLLEAVSVDVKAPLEPIPYRRNAGPGSDPAEVRRTLELLAEAGLPVEVRTTVHPDLLSLDELRRLASQAGGIFSQNRSPVRYTAQRCRTEDPLDRALSDRPAQDPSDFELWSAASAEAFEKGRLGERGS